MGYIMKDSGAESLIQAVRSVYSGHIIMSPSMMQGTTSDADDQRALSPSEPSELTARELEVLQGIVDGLTNQAIAIQMGISKTTVRSHVSSILAKLNVTNRTQAALLANEHHLL